MMTATKPDPPAFLPVRRYVVLRRAVRKRLGWYPIASYDTRERAEAEARHWYFELACTRFETDFRVIDAAA